MMGVCIYLRNKELIFLRMIWPLSNQIWYHDASTSASDVLRVKSNLRMFRMLWDEFINYIAKFSSSNCMCYFSGCFINIKFISLGSFRSCCFTPISSFCVFKNVWERRIRLTDCPLPCIKTHILCLIFENIELELSPSRPWFSQAYDFNAPSCDVERLIYFQSQSMSHDRLVSFVLRQQYLDCMLFPWWDFLFFPSPGTSPAPHPSLKEISPSHFPSLPFSLPPHAHTPTLHLV